MGRKTGNFYRIMHREQGREKLEMSDWLGTHTVSPVWGEKAQHWLGGRLTGCTELLKRNITRTQKLSQLWFANVSPQAGVAFSWA